MDKKTVGKLLANLDIKELYGIISQLTCYSEEAEEWFLDYCSKLSNNADTSLVAEKQVLHYWSVAEDIIDEANIYGGTYHEGDAYDALYKIEDLAKSNDISWECRCKIVDAMMEQFYLGNSGFDDILVDSCEALCQTKEENLYLADKLRDSSSVYYRQQAATIYLKNGMDDAFIDLQSKNLVYGSDYICLADYYKNNGQLDKAIGLVEEALDNCDGILDDVYRWLFTEYKLNNQENKILELYKIAVKKGNCVSTITELLYEYYSGDYEKKKPYLLKMVEVCDDCRAREWYDECKKVLTTSDFEKESEHLHMWLKKKNVHDYLQLRIDEGNKEEVLNYLKDNPVRREYYNVDRGHNLSKQLISDYPKDVIDLYWKECERLCLTTGNRKIYDEVVNILREIKRIYKKEDLYCEWIMNISAFTEKHKRKRLLMDRIYAEMPL